MTSIDDIPIRPDRTRKFPVGQLVSVAISIIALAVSGLSLWQSRKNAALQNELARPLLEASDVRVVPDAHTSEMSRLTMTVRNAGHLTAFVTAAVTTPNLPLLKDNGVLRWRCYPDKDQSIYTSYPYGDEIAPGAERDMSVGISVTPPDCMGDPHFLNATVTFTYHDRTGNIPYVQPIVVVAKVTNETP